MEKLVEMLPPISYVEVLAEDNTNLKRLFQIMAKLLLEIYGHDQL